MTILSTSIRHLSLSQRSLLRQTTIRPLLSATSSDAYWSHKHVKTVAIAAFSLTVGFALGYKDNKKTTSTEILPSGYPRACCEGPSLSDRSDAQKDIVKILKQTVGDDCVTVDTETTCANNNSNILCQVSPPTLQSTLDAAQAIIDAGCAIHVAGSTPSPISSNKSDRPTVVFNMSKLNKVFPLDGGKRICVFAGTTAEKLSRWCVHYLDHRTSPTEGCRPGQTMGASLALGAVGTMLRKGPVYTERVLYLQVNDKGIVELVNRLNIRDHQAVQPDDEELLDCGLPEPSGENPEYIQQEMRTAENRTYLEQLERYANLLPLRRGEYSVKRNSVADQELLGRDVSYRKHITTIPEDTTDVAQWSGTSRTSAPLLRSEGKVILLASIHDTLRACVGDKQVYWIGFDSLETATDFREKVVLKKSSELPILCQYVDQETWNVIDQAGRALALPMRMLGGQPTHFQLVMNAKERLGNSIDKFLFQINDWLPPIFPTHIYLEPTLQKMPHHVILKAGDFGNNGLEKFRKRMYDFNDQVGPSRMIVHNVSLNESDMDVFLFLAAPAFQIWCAGHGYQWTSLKYALPMNTKSFPNGMLPSPSLKRIRCAQFGSNIINDYLAVDGNVNLDAFKRDCVTTLQQNHHGKLPVEDGFGDKWEAPNEVKQRWELLDPLNLLNPGVGGTSTEYRYGKPPPIVVAQPTTVAAKRKWFWIF
jgi:D-lactate dehydrogenase